MPRVVFRCDASSTIGSGHVARCMALARALRSRGAEVHLLSRALPQRVHELLVSDTGVIAHELPDAPVDEPADEGSPLPHAHWLGVPQKLDAQHTTQLLRKLGTVEWMIVDHYGLDARWERAVKPLVGRILVLDDLADREHDCDALLDQNFFIEADKRYASLAPAGTLFLLGPKYALLRDEFAEQRERLAPRDGTLRRIFVCFGGFDRPAQTSRAFDALEAAALPGVAVDVVLGRDDPQRPDVERRCAAQRGWRVHFDASNVAELMAGADLALGASGIMNWERAALRLPAIVASVAENQQVVARDLAATQACIYLGLAAAWRPETLTGFLRGLSGTPSLLQALAARAGELTDGRGARRVASRLMPLQLELRRATAADTDAMLAWRNADETRQYAFDSSLIAPEAHRRWFDRVLTDTSVALLVGEYRGKPVGVLRYDLAGERATVSVYLVPGTAGDGLGSALLATGSGWLREHYPAVNHVEAHIRHGNDRSVAAFTNAGYRPRSHTYTHALRP